jgi:hypothetical protein
MESGYYEVFQDEVKGKLKCPMNSEKGAMLYTKKLNEAVDEAKVIRQPVHVPLKSTRPLKTTA